MCFAVQGLVCPVAVSMATQCPLGQGSAVAAEGCPFGTLAPRHMDNHRLQGIVSARLQAAGKVIALLTCILAILLLVISGWFVAWPPRPFVGHHPKEWLLHSQVTLFILDVQPLPGMEGGPVTLLSTGQVVGMLLQPLRAAAAQVHVALAAPGDAVLQALGWTPAAPGPGGTAHAWRPAAASGTGHPSFGFSSSRSSIEVAARSVVAVQTSGSWASGVILTPAGHVLTNAHLLQPRGLAGHASRQWRAEYGVGSQAATDVPRRQLPSSVLVLVGPPGSGRWHLADVLYVFKGSLDLAVVKLRGAAGGKGVVWQAIQLRDQEPCPGQPIGVLGFPVFNPVSLLGAVATHGSIAKVGALPLHVRRCLPRCIY